MSVTVEQLQGIMTGTQEGRVEALRQILDYPLKQRDPEGSRFWFLRPGSDEDEAEDTCPIAVGFYSELSELIDIDIKQFLTADEQQREIYGHYTGRIIPNQPVMYLLLPEGDLLGRVAMILPTDGKLRQRQIQTFSWSNEDFHARLNRLRQDTLARTNRMKDAALSVIPLVEWAFYKPIITAKELAQKLAEVSRRIERVIPDVYRAEPPDGYLRRLLRSFQKELLPTLKLEPENDKDYSFADIYAQTIAYGLFTARVFSYTLDERRRRDEADPARKETDFNREDAWELLPETNPFLRRLFRDVSKAVGEYDRGTALDESPVIADELIDAIAEVVSILRAAKMDAILEDFRAKMNREDIVIRFYEDFLAAYKPQMRERRGVYYTPEPVVSYMVRSVDILLKEKFNKPLGLADPEVMILDPACGTGTFLLWIFQLIHQRFQENPDALTDGLEDRSWSSYVKERLLPRIFGFELLMAPYAIAHLKLGLFLEETGYQFDSGKRLRVYLTNALEQESPEKPAIPYEEFIAAEGEASLEVKQTQKIVVVVGNPPYSYESKNRGEWISNAVQDYYYIDSQPLDEKNPKGLQDDYVKFIRFSQWRIDRTGYGILAFISNHGYIDNPTFRGMRHSLLNSFSEISVFDLHGNSSKKERSPDGSDDKNVFDIQQGVSISLFVKELNHSCQFAKTFHSDLWGLQRNKYEYLLQNSISTTPWIEVSPYSPFYLLKPVDITHAQEYSAAWSIIDAMLVKTPGIVTARDDLTIHSSRESVWNTVNEFASLPPEEARNRFGLVQDTRDWLVQSAQKDLIRTGLSKENISPILYRPFDIQYTYYTSTWKGFHSLPRGDVMHHMIDGENLGLIIVRQVAEGIFNHVFVTDSIVDNRITSSNKGYGQLFPLYLYPDASSPQRSAWEETKRVNFSQLFLTAIKNKLGYLPVPEDIFYYIYSILHSPVYRTRYAEFLKIDFARIPLTGDDNLFRQLASYGKELVALHLMKSLRIDNLITETEGAGSWIVEAGHPKYLDNKIIINKKGDGFIKVPEVVWNFYVGGYQVCHKWLKDRKGCTLSSEDIIHYQRIIVTLQETIRLMHQIDDAIPVFPLP